MAKLTIMRGLPASGKSTRAKEIVETAGNTVRINKDLLRTMLHFDKWLPRNEGKTHDAAHALAQYFLAHNVNVIIDDTNLNPQTIETWKSVALKMKASIEYVDMTGVSVEECIARDAQREKAVGRRVIECMALQHLGYLAGQAVVVCDLDGTLCDISHRLHFAQSEPKDWGSFFAGVPQDTLRLDVLNAVDEVRTTHQAWLVLVSARPETYRMETEEWLAKHQIKYTTLIMRPAHDKRPDTEVKAEMYDKYLKALNIVKVFDDRPRVIAMWREKGLDVEDVGNGIDF